MSMCYKIVCRSIARFGRPEQYANHMVASYDVELLTQCYPNSLRLIANSMGPTAEMLMSCMTTVVDGMLH
jgi:hypothetical protein